MLSGSCLTSAWAYVGGGFSLFRDSVSASRGVGGASCGGPAVTRPVALSRFRTPRDAPVQQCRFECVSFEQAHVQPQAHARKYASASTEKEELPRQGRSPTYNGKTPPPRERGGCTHVMHGRNRKTMDPRIPAVYNAGMEHVGFSPTRQAWLAPSAKRNVRCRAGHINPFRTAVLCWGHASLIPSVLSPKRDCGPKTV